MLHQWRLQLCGIYATGKKRRSLASVVDNPSTQVANNTGQPMKTPIRRRQLRGLVLHHRRHPSTHPRRLVNRTARWGEPPGNGICRWCYEPTAHIRTRWHLYCLNAYRVASGQHPEEIQHTLCQMCGEGADEIDHRLAINVARALGPAAMLRAFTPDNLRWLCRRCHRHKTRQDRLLAKFITARSLDCTVPEGCSIATASGRCRFCCRAAWSRTSPMQRHLRGSARRQPSDTGGIYS